MLTSTLWPPSRHREGCSHAAEELAHLTTELPLSLELPSELGRGPGEGGGAVTGRGEGSSYITVSAGQRPHTPSMKALLQDLPQECVATA